MLACHALLPKSYIGFPKDVECIHVGSEVLEAGLLLERVGGDAGQAAVGIAFADENAAMRVVADDELDTSRIDTADLQVKMRNGAPIKLGQGTASQLT